MGRFLQTDPIGLAGGTNVYGYAGGDPVNGVDPSGLADLPSPPPYPLHCDGGDICVNGSPYGDPLFSLNDLLRDENTDLTAFLNNRDNPHDQSPDNTQPPIVVTAKRLPKRDFACRVSNALQSFAKSDADVAFGLSFGKLAANSVPGRLAIRVAKGLTDVTDVFGTAAFIEGTGAAIINGIKSGDYRPAVLDVISELVIRISPLEGSAKEGASRINEQFIAAGKFKNPCN
jgi:hypothetical protein